MEIKRKAFFCFFRASIGHQFTNPDFKSDVLAAVAIVDAKAPSYGWTGVCSINQVKMPYSNVAANKLYMLELGLFCTLIISNYWAFNIIIIIIIFNFSFQIRCLRMYQDFMSSPNLVRGYLQYCKCFTIYFVIQLLSEPDKLNCNLCLVKVSLS